MKILVQLMEEMKINQGKMKNDMETIHEEKKNNEDELKNGTINIKSASGQFLENTENSAKRV